MGPAAARFYGDPTAELRRGRHHRHQRQDHHRLPGAPPARGRRASSAGCSARSTRSSAAREEEVERTTPEAIDLQATFRRDARRAATAPARWRSPRTRSSSAAPSGIRFACRVFTNLTQDHLDFHPTMEDYFAAKRRLFEGARAGGRERRRRVRAPARRRASDARDLRDRARRRLPRARRRASTCGLALPLRDAGRRRSSCDSPLPGLFNVQNALARGRRGALARRAARRRSPAALPRLRARAGPLRAGGRGPGLRRARGLRAHARLARERAARRARDHRAGACTWCSAPAATATAPSAR